jgi:SpoVK/Ycf46/Vps4 family AAA+-type ATPase
MKSDSLIRKIREAETKVARAHKAIKHGERHFVQDLQKVSDENSNLRVNFANLRTLDAVKEKSEPISQADTSKLEQLRSELKERESVLVQARDETNSLKRELNRITHESLIAKRRAALRI